MPAEPGPAAILHLRARVKALEGRSAARSAHERRVVERLRSFGNRPAGFVPSWPGRQKPLDACLELT